MTELSSTQLSAAKGLATEIALLALLRTHREDRAFWESLDKLTAIVLALDLQESPLPEVARMAERTQEFLDSWRQIAGTDPNQPAPSGSLPGGLPPAA